MNDKTTVEYCSGALKGENFKELLAAGKKACDEYGFKLGVQIHNTAELSEMEILHDMGIPLSFHAPALTEYSINLAAEDVSLSMECFEVSAKWMRKFGADKAVFHGFFMTDKPIPAFGRGRSYDECAQTVLRPELLLENSFMCRNFFDSSEFRERLARVKERLPVLKKYFPDLTFLMENDHPGYLSGMILPEFFLETQTEICLDTSHLWSAAFVFDRDFHEEVGHILKTGRVKMVHLHASPFTAAVPKEKWSDGHKNLSTPNEMDLPRLVAACKRAGARHFVLEFNEASENDIHLFADMWSKAK